MNASTPIPPRRLTAGIDWTSEDHAVAVVDPDGVALKRCTFEHTGAGLRALVKTPHDVTDTAVTGGVDTHLGVHVAAALDRIGGLLGTASFPTTPDGYQQLLRWLRSFGTIVQVCVSHGRVAGRRALQVLVRLPFRKTLAK